jgi:hypothetical protein
MKIKMQICLLVLVSFALIIQSVQVSRAADHDLWLLEVLKEIQTIQPDKTRREDLVKIFRRSGGLSRN